VRHELRLLAAVPIRRLAWGERGRIDAIFVLAVEVSLSRSRRPSNDRILLIDNDDGELLKNDKLK
jgi:hypothetical protein